MGKDYAASGFGPLNLGTISTAAGLTGSWKEIPPYKNHTIAVKIAGSTATITGSLTLQGRLSTAGVAVTLASWSSTLGTGVPKNSTNNVAVNYVRITSTGFASTASTGTVAVTANGWYAGV